MGRLLGEERGMALAIAILALVVLGAVVAGALYVAAQEQRGAENLHRLGQSLGIAEAGAPELIGQWDNDSFNVLRVFPTDTYHVGTRATDARTGAFGGSVWKLNRNLYLIDLEGRDTHTRTGGAAFRRRGDGSRQRVGVLARVRPPAIPMAGAFVTQGATSRAGGSVVDGTDRTPNATWTACAAPDTAQAGLRTDGTASASGGPTTLAGSPPLLQDSAINNTTFDVLGDQTYAQLAAGADKVIPGGSSVTDLHPSSAGGVCHRSDPRNWGDGEDRAGPCGNYFPVIHVAGDLVVRNGQGQGVLLVDGNLEVSGSFTFYGVTIVQGALSTSGDGASPPRFVGTVLAKNQSGMGNSISGAAELLYSKCAIVEALQYMAPGAMLRSRGFVLLHAAPVAGDP